MSPRLWRSDKKLLKNLFKKVNNKSYRKKQLTQLVDRSLSPENKVLRLRFERLGLF